MRNKTKNKNEETMSKNIAANKEKETNNVAETEVKEENIPEKVQEAYDSLMAQVKTFNDQELKAGTMKIKGLGAIEVLVQMYPKLQQQKSDS